MTFNSFPDRINDDSVWALKVERTTVKRAVFTSLCLTASTVEYEGVDSWDWDSGPSFFGRFSWSFGNGGGEGGGESPSLTIMALAIRTADMV